MAGNIVLDSRDGGNSEEHHVKSGRSNKRARLVCLYCHDKKVRCDLQLNPTAACSNCSEAGIECSVRASRRVKGRRRAETLANSEPTRTTLLNSTKLQSHIPTPNSNPNHSHDGILDSSGIDDDFPAMQMVDDDTVFGSNYPTAYPDHTILNVALGHPSKRRDGNPGASRLTSGHASALPERHFTPVLGQPESAVASYLGESGLIPMFSRHNDDRDYRGSRQPFSDDSALKVLPGPVLQESYVETYFRYCHTWCPVLERDSSGRVNAMADSKLLQHAVALVGSLIEPPIMNHPAPSTHYYAAKELFNANQEKSPIVAISAIMLFYWWGCGSPDIVSMDTVWWWTGVAIRMAQQLGLHREPKAEQRLVLGETTGLRRRIWWTLFARERLTGICQGRPCIIDPEDCNIAELTLNDFPEPQDERQSELFIYWVRLCRIIGKVSKHLSTKKESAPFPTELARQLKGWVQSLPCRLQLPIHTQVTTRFNRDVHLLHLPYLTTVALLYLETASAQSLPKAYSTAMLASCCISRIFEDFIARGSIRYLQGIAGWSISIALLALLHARKITNLKEAADAHIFVLRRTLKEMAKLWHSAKMFDRGFSRLINGGLPHSPSSNRNSVDREMEDDSNHALLDQTNSPASDIIDWVDFFPYLTAHTSSLAAIILEPTPVTLFTDLDLPLNFPMQLQDFLDSVGGFNDF